MAADDDRRIAAYYDGLVERYGHDPRACDYGRAQSQAIKFKVLSEVLSLSGLTLLDVGCGFADYVDFLNAHNAPAAYSGVDLSVRMIDEARTLHPETNLTHGNILESNDATMFDVVSANGIFYLLGNDALRQMRELIRRMFALSRAALAFNSLSTWASIQEAGEFYADPLETLAFCRTLSPHVVLRHDYLPHDFTIYLYREPRR